MTNTKFWTLVGHTLVQGIVWTVPLIILNLGNLGDLTVSGLLSAFSTWLTHKYLM